MNKITILLLVVVALSWVNADIDKDWEDFKSKHGKKYDDPTEGAKRKKIFASTDAKIKAHNSKNAGYQMAHNKFSDMTQEEKSKHLGVKAVANNNRESVFIPQDRQLPASIDYRTDACLAPVKNQGGCGSCWAFTTIASLEFSMCKKTGSKITLSEQQLVDCDKGNYGCNGGFWGAWTYLKNGTAQSSSYAYTATVGTCKFTSSMSAGKVSTWNYVGSGNPVGMQNALKTYGPLAVALTVVDSFYSYSSGVYLDATCTGDKMKVNHAVNIVGYATLDGVDYWIVRNSWGSWWGSNGYILIKRGVNMCNIEDWPAYVVAA